MNNCEAPLITRCCSVKSGSVLTKPVILRIRSTRSSDPSVIADFVDAAQLQSGANIVNIDAIGVGWGVCGLVRERFARRQSPSSAPVVVAINSAASPTTPQAKALYGNLRAQLWWEFRLALQQNLLDTSRADNRMELEAQLLMPRYHINKGKIWVEAKAEIKMRLGRSPDNADALMYALHQSRASGVARMASSASTLAAINLL